jgi:peroxisomal membrane protein 2
MAALGQQLLVQYITALNTNPLRTKMLTSGTLAALAEILAGKFAGVGPASKKLPPGQVSEKKAFEQQPVRFTQAVLENIGINEKALKMFVYGFAVSAPLGHVMTGACHPLIAPTRSSRLSLTQIMTSSYH